MFNNKTFNLNSTFKWLAIAGVVAGLSACGGGGGGGGSSSSSQMTIAGTAATGKALDNAAIAVTCVAGAGTATSNAAGKYTVTITDGKGPCIITATKGTTVLRSVASGAGTYNVTPLTDVLVEFLLGRSGITFETLLSNPNGRALLADASAMTAAQNSVIAYFQAQYNITLTGDFLTAVITTPEGGAQSQSDKDLDTLKDRGVLNAEGEPVSTVLTGAKTEGQKAPYVAPTGATGGTGSSS
jgi:hypothetical protein